MFNTSHLKIIASSLLVCCLTACNGSSENQANDGQVKNNDASATLNAPNAEAAIKISDTHFKNAVDIYGENPVRRKAIEIYDLSNKLRAYEVTGYDAQGKAIGFLNIPVAKGFGLFTQGGEGSRSERITQGYKNEWKPLLEKNGIKILSHKMVGHEMGFIGMAVKTDKPLSEASTDTIKNYFADFARTAYQVDNNYYVLSFFPESKTDFSGLK